MVELTRDGDDFRLTVKLTGGISLTRRPNAIASCTALEAVRGALNFCLSNEPLTIDASLHDELRETLPMAGTDCVKQGMDVAL